MSAHGPQAADLAGLRAEGFVVVRRFLPGDVLRGLHDAARAQLAARQEPLELEADLQYPGAPPTRDAAGGATVRRLLDAYGREPQFAAAAAAPAVRDWMRGYFGEDVSMSRAHHNCLMTKHPRYGSLTGWHRDIRYWSFARPELVSVWFALGAETAENGGLWFVPASHQLALDGDRFDAAKFFRADRPDNAALIHTAVSPSLAAGDAVFFHCNTLHSAGRNGSDACKFSLVFTYHARSNRPMPGTRSAARAEVEL